MECMFQGDPRADEDVARDDVLSDDASGNAAARGDVRKDDAAPVVSHRRRNALTLVIVALAWLAFDVITKCIFSPYAAGEVVADAWPGVLRFHLVHNTGGAWGMFGDMTIVLAVVSVLVCALLLVYVFVIAPSSSVGVVFGLALVIAGGLGNAIERFSHGYVTDFIEVTFVNFPVFNIADMGVTCGVVVFLVSLVVEWFARS